MRSTSTLQLTAFSALLTGLVGCSATYDVAFEVTLDDVLSRHVGRVVMVVQPTDSSPADVFKSNTFQRVRMHKATVTTCCAPNPEVELYAYLDEDGDGVWDPAEARAAHAGNPVTLNTPTTHVKLALAAVAEPVIPDLFE